MLNPPARMKVAYDSGVRNWFDPELIQKLPVAMKPGDSLVSTISMPKGLVLHAQLRNKFERGVEDSSPIRVAAVLTCVREPQPPDAFRPAFCAGRQTILLARNLKRELLPKAARSGSMPRVEQYIRFTERPWVGTCFFGFEQPVENRDSSLNSTIPELPGSGWLAAEPEATPQAHRLRPWGFPTVSPSHPSVFPHHGIQRITVEFSEKSRFLARNMHFRFARWPRGWSSGHSIHIFLASSCLPLPPGVPGQHTHLPCFFPDPDISTRASRMSVRRGWTRWHERAPDSFDGKRSITSTDRAYAKGIFVIVLVS
jgi:hypothetical protein